MIIIIVPEFLWWIATHAFISAGNTYNCCILFGRIFWRWEFFLFFCKFSNLFRIEEVVVLWQTLCRECIHIWSRWFPAMRPVSSFIYCWLLFLSTLTCSPRCPHLLTESSEMEAMAAIPRKVWITAAIPMVRYCHRRSRLCRNPSTSQTRPLSMPLWWMSWCP